MRAFFCKTTAADFFGGLGLFPLCGLAVSVFSVWGGARFVTGNTFHTKTRKIKLGGISAR